MNAVHADVVILTALEEEHAAVVRVLGDCTAQRWRGRTLRTGQVGALQVLAFPMGGMGNPGSAQAATLAISVWNPAYIILTGIAAGIPGGDLRLGDVLVPDRIVGYEPAKVRAGGAEHRYEVLQPDWELLQAAQSLDPRDWALGISAPRPDGQGRRVIPRAFFGPVFSGEKVLADGAVVAALRQDWSKAIGAEMEGLGVAVAAYRGGPAFLMVKAVSDFADGEKNDDWHAYAAESAARFAIAVLKTAPARPEASRAVRARNGSLAADVTDFTALIDEHTEEFVGRRRFGERLWATLDDDDFGSGYLFVHGEPGIGKTALLAKLVRERDLIHHFNSVLIGITSREHFLRNVCAQLILRYELSDERLPADATSHSGVLLDLLSRAAARSDQVLVAIDAIDEAVAAENAENRLFLPPSLPPGVFFVVTMRDPEDVELYVDEPRHLPLLEADAENQADVREYIAAFLKRHRRAMSRRLGELGVRETDFAETLADRSEGNFMYLRHVLRGVRYGTLGGLDPDGTDQLPRGLRAYYAYLEKQLLRRTGNDPEKELAILGVLAAWPSPLTRRRLARFAGENTTVAGAVLRRWSPFLNEVRSGQEPAYALYHASFRDYLAERLPMDTVREGIETAIEAELT
ncbi:MAG TPA: AAA family ATPase [Streptosporangiaceae bacterium]|nr:AAA family ATPase [Streptosporangiaceae bacterium]